MFSKDLNDDSVTHLLTSSQQSSLSATSVTLFDKAKQLFGSNLTNDSCPAIASLCHVQNPHFPTLVGTKKKVFG
jgi:hypothetical protein